MSDELLDLDAIETRANMASPGPWQWQQCFKIEGLYGPFLTTWHWAITDPTAKAQNRITNSALILLEAEQTDPDSTPFDQTPDFDFIAHARDDVPALVAEVRWLQSEIGRLLQEVPPRLATIDRLQSEVDRLQEEVPSLTADVTRLQSELDSLDTECLRWHDWERTWVFGGSAPWPGRADEHDPRRAVDELTAENKRLRTLLTECVEALKSAGHASLRLADRTTQQIDDLE